MGRGSRTRIPKNLSRWFMDGPKLKNDWMDHVSTKVRIFNFYEVKLFRVQTNWWICGKHFAVIILKIYLIKKKSKEIFEI